MWATALADPSSWQDPPGTPIASGDLDPRHLVSFTTDSDPTLAQRRSEPPRPAISSAYTSLPLPAQEFELQFPNGNRATPISPLTIPSEAACCGATAKNAQPPVPGQSNAVGPGKFYREYILKITAGQLQLPDQAQLQPDGTPLPGLIAGQYRFPIFEYIFTEGTLFGEPIPPNNYNDFGFLATGPDFLMACRTVIGRLDPWPQP